MLAYCAAEAFSRTRRGSAGRAATRAARLMAGSRDEARHLLGSCFRTHPLLQQLAGAIRRFLRQAQIDNQLVARQIGVFGLIGFYPCCDLNIVADRSMLDDPERAVQRVRSTIENGVAVGLHGRPICVFSRDPPAPLIRLVHGSRYVGGQRLPNTAQPPGIAVDCPKTTRTVFEPSTLTSSLKIDAPEDVYVHPDAASRKREVREPSGGPTPPPARRVPRIEETLGAAKRFGSLFGLPSRELLSQRLETRYSLLHRDGCRARQLNALLDAAALSLQAYDVGVRVFRLRWRSILGFRLRLGSASRVRARAAALRRPPAAVGGAGRGGARGGP